MKSGNHQKDRRPRQLPPLEGFAVELRKRRGYLKMSQRQLAEIAGTTQATIANIEAGKANPRYSTLASIAAVMNMEIRLTLVRQLPKR